MRKGYNLREHKIRERARRAEASGHHPISHAAKIISLLLPGKKVVLLMEVHNKDYVDGAIKVLQKHGGKKFRKRKIERGYLVERIK